MSDRSWVHRQDPQESIGEPALFCLLLGPGCIYILGLVIVNETFSLPVNMVRSQTNQMEVAFVFGSEDELLYLYEVGVYPPVRFSQAIRTLRHPLMSELNDDFTTVVDRVTGYIAEARQRAEEVGHVFTETDEESLGEDLQTAESIDAGIITKEEATAMRPSKFLATYNS